MEDKHFYSGVIRLLVLSFVSIILLFPIIIILLLSFQTFESLVNNHWSSGDPIWTDENYKMVFDNFLPSLLFTLLILIFHLFMSLLILLPASFAISQLNIPYKKIFSFIFAFVVFIPSSALITEQYKLISELGFTSGFGGYILGLSIPFAYSYLGFIVLLSGFDNIDSNLKVVATTENIPTYKYFIITLKMIKKEVLWVIILLAINVWNSFLFPRLILMGSDFRVLTLWIFDISIDPIDGILHPEIQMAASIISSIPLVVMFLVFRKSIFEAINIKMK